MKPPRIYLPQALQPQQRATLDARAANHVINVLRLKPGASLTLFNGRGGEYAAELVTAGKRGAEVELKDHIDIEREAPFTILLAQGISRGEKMDYTIQKSVELGVTTIIPLITERCGVKLAGERASKRLEHWQAVAASACEQCGRNRLPTIADMRPLPDWLRSLATLTAHPQTTRLVLAPHAQTTLKQLPAPQQLELLIGPEGGLSDAEIALAMDYGFNALRLGPRILRTETAAVTALSAALTLWGDLG